MHKQVEMLMESWTEHSKTGFHVRMLIGPEDIEYFKGCPQGQRFAAMLVRLTDQDEPAPAPTPADVSKQEKKAHATGVAEATERDKEFAQPHRGHGFPGGLCGLAVKWCDDPHFQEWMQHTYGGAWSTYDSGLDAQKEVARLTLCEVAGVESRKEFDTNPDAEKFFREEIMAPYAAHRKEAGIDE